jgi:cyanophycin synthetase
LIHLNGKRVGLACADGLYLDRRMVERSDSANWEAANRILLNRGVEAAVLENGGMTMVGQGLAYDRCQIGVVTAIDPAARIPEFDIETPEQMYNVLRTQVDVVLTSGAAVLNAHDPRVLEMARLCDGEVILFGSEPLAALAAHRAAGGRCVVVAEGEVRLAAGPKHTVVAKLSGLNAGKDAPLAATAVLAAVAVAWALGISRHIIRAGIETFELDETFKSASTRH